jgi:hypothetical protein
MLFQKNKFIIGSTLIGLFVIMFIVFLVCYCYVHCMKIKRMKQEFKPITENSKMNSILEKTMSSMKKVTKNSAIQPNNKLEFKRRFCFALEFRVCIDAG